MALKGLVLIYWKFLAAKQIQGLDPVPKEAEPASWALSCCPAAVFVPRGTPKPPGSTLKCAILSFFWLQG